MAAQDWRGGVQVSVTPEVLRQQAAEVTNRINRLSARFSELEATINHTRHYWIGEAGELHRQMYDEKKELLQEMMVRFREYPVSLLKISGNYVEAEDEIMAKITALGGSVIR